MNLRELMKNASNSVLVVCGTILALGVLGAIVYLSAQGKDATAVKQYVDSIVQFLALILGGTATVAAGAAAKTADEAKTAAEKTVEQTNGVMDARIEEAVHRALHRQNHPDENPDQGRLL